MNSKPQISVDADALKQVLTALVGPGHLIRELQAVRGLPSLGGVTHDPIGTLINQFTDYENREVEATKRSEPHSAVALQATIAQAAEDQSDREVASMRLSEIATGADSLVTGEALKKRLGL